jgi:hypothetical protein
MKKIIVITFLSCLAVGALFCSEMSVAGNGGSSETINAKVIVSDTIVSVTDNNGDEVSLILEAFSSDYKPYEKIGYSAILDNDKDKVLELPSAGDYNFLIRNREGNLTGFIKDVKVLHGAKDSATCVLTTGSSVNGRLISQGSDSLDEQYAVSIYGSPFICVTDKERAFSMKTIPDGSYTMSVRPIGKRLFIATARYTFTTSENGKRTQLDVVVP